MRGGLHGIDSAAASIQLLNALQPAGMECVVYHSGQLREGADERDERSESDLTGQPDQSRFHACPCHSARDCDCTDGRCADADDDGSAEDGEQIGVEQREARGEKCRTHDSCAGSGEHSTIECQYINASAESRSAEGQGVSARLRLGHESGDSEFTDPDAATTTGEFNHVHTGVTQ